MNNQDEIKGRLQALEFLLSHEIAARLSKEPNPVLSISAYDELATAALNLEAVAGGTVGSVSHTAAVTALKSVLSSAKQFVKSS